MGDAVRGFAPGDVVSVPRPSASHPSRAEALALVAAGRLHPELVTGTQVGWEDAVEALRDATGKVVVTRRW